MTCVLLLFLWLMLASLVALVDTETEPVFLAAAVDCILGILGDGAGRGGTKNVGPQLGSTQRGPRPSACPRASLGRPRAARL